eukprot:TRINITY_DN2546_c0_g1_i1.p1 TRINITY_DN2546_c0_g1~~TRINITY_DN2546_c0_g1_i1.p1  ORF type:complete len:818 (-),score=69.00 TRINITY_DN2546_c0_g1_i1:211-2664(-)
MKTQSVTVLAFVISLFINNIDCADIEYNVTSFSSLLESVNNMTGCNNTIILNSGDYFFNQSIQLKLTTNCSLNPNRIIGMEGVRLFPEKANITETLVLFNQSIYTFNTNNVTGLNSSTVLNAYVHRRNESVDSGYFLKHYPNYTSLSSGLANFSKGEEKIPLYGFSIQSNITYVRLPDNYNVDNLNLYVTFTQFPLFQISSNGLRITNVTFFACQRCIKSIGQNILIDHVRFFNTFDGVDVRNQTTIQYCHFEVYGMKKFRLDFVSNTPSNSISDSFSQLFFSKFSPQGGDNTINLYGRNTSIIRDVIIEYNVFDNTPGLLIETTESVTIRNNYFLEVYTSISFANSDQLKISFNMMINITTPLESGSSNNRVYMFHNVFYTHPDFRPFLYYYIYTGNYFSPTANDKYIAVRYNTFWACNYNECRILPLETENGVLTEQLVFENNIVQLGRFIKQSTVNPIILNSSHNLVIGTQSTDLVMVNESYCSLNGSSMCIYTETVESIFRNPSKYNFGINPCFLKSLETSLTPNSTYFLRYPDWIGGGLGSSSSWLSEDFNGQYVGAFPINQNPPRSWPLIDTIPAFKTTIVQLCNCTQISRKFLNISFIDRNECDLNITSNCSTCSGESFVVNQSSSTLTDNLNFSNSNIIFQGNVTLDELSTLTLSNSTLVILGSFSLTTQSDLVVSKDTSISVEGDANLSGDLIVDLRSLSLSEYSTVIANPLIIIKYSNLTDRFQSFEVLLPTMVATTGSITNNPPTFDLQYLSDKLLLVPSSSNVQIPTMSPTMPPTISYSCGQSIIDSINIIAHLTCIYTLITLLN